MEMKALLYYRSKLDPHDQSVYDSLVNQWMHFESNIHIPVPHSDFSLITQAIHFDYPLLFYVNYYHIVYSQNIFGMNIIGDYVYSKSEAEVLLGKCEQWGNFIFSNAPSNLGMAEKALWLHDVILNNVKYGESNGIRSHNIIGVVQEGVAVCEGISMAYKFLCDLLDIPCIYVSGTLNGSPHGWNMLWINNETSFVDVTNDINTYSGSFGRSNFLRNSKEMSGYSWNTALIPECRLTNKTNSYVTAYSMQELVQIISRMNKTDNIGIHLQFDHLLTDNEMQYLITICTIRCPMLITKSVSFSQERQMIYIQNR